MKGDQVALVAYDDLPDGTRGFAELRTWTIRHQWLTRVPDRFIFGWLAALPLKLAYRRNKLNLMFNHLYKNYVNENTPNKDRL